MNEMPEEGHITITHWRAGSPSLSDINPVYEIWCSKFVNTLSSLVAIKFRVKGGGIKSDWRHSSTCSSHVSIQHVPWQPASQHIIQQPFTLTTNGVVQTPDTWKINKTRVILHKKTAATRPPGHESKRTHTDNDLMTGAELRAGLGNRWPFQSAPRAYPPSYAMNTWESFPRSKPVGALS